MTQLIRRAWSIFRDEGTLPLLRSSADYLTDQLSNQRDLLNIPLRYLVNRLQYGPAVANPFDLIYVDPDNIKYDQLDCTATDWNNRKRKWQNVARKHNTKIANKVAKWYHPDGGRFRRKKNLGKIIDGDWDQHTRPWTQRRVYQSIKMVYDEGADWRDTPLFRKRTAIYELTGNAYGYDVEDPIGKRISYIENLHDSIQNHGFLTQRQAPDDHRNRDIFHNITINIGRRGELIFNHAGQHRLAFAKYLDVDRVPVLVIVRHRRWQEVRNKMYHTKTEDALDSTLVDYYDHPDLRDVRPG